ncbi:MAG: hypothetical protein ACTSRK_20505 [Promethearchaeota archaeon]
MRFWLGDGYQLQQVQCLTMDTLKKQRIIQGKKNYSVKVEDVAKLEAVYSSTAGQDIKVSMAAYWGNTRLMPREHLFCFYQKVIGIKGSLRLKNITLGFLIGKKPFFHIHGVYQIDYKDGTHEKISTSRLFSNSGANLAIREFINGENSRNSAWFAEEMLLLINSTYLSHRRQDSVITPEDLRAYTKEFFSSGYSEEAYRKYLTDLLGL